MNEIISENDTREQRVNGAIAEYLAAAQSGNKPDRADWLSRHADVARELEEFLNDQELFQEMVSPLQVEADTVDLASAPSNDEPMDALAGAHFSAASAIPTLIGDYEILDEIARGGMGVVFRARQRSLNRIVALKMVLGSRLASAKDIERFHREAEAIAALDHPNIVPIYEVGKYEELPYFSMKLIENGSLSNHRDFYQGNPRAAAKLLATAARAIHHAHQRGILHRDLKPSNLLLDKQGEPHIADFGLAKSIEATAAGREHAGDLSQSGAVIGTPSYMAPEQARGNVKSLTTSVDVYGLGAILYELLGGKPPFRGETTAETLLMILSEEPAPPSKLRCRTPRDLETICLKCLSKEPGKRYGSAEAFAQDLERFLTGEPIVARPVRHSERAWRWCGRNPVLASLLGTVAALVVVVAAMSVFWAAQMRSDLAATRQAEREALLERDAAEAARGKEAAAKALAERAQLAEKIRARELSQALIDKDGALDDAMRNLANGNILLAQADWNRNSNANLAKDYLHRIPPKFRNIEWGYLKHKLERGLFTIYGHSGPVAFSPDGSRIVTGCTDNTVRVWDARSGMKLLELKAQNETVGSLALSGDGSRIVTASWEGIIRVWDFRTGKSVLQLKGPAGWAGCVMCNFDGSEIVMASPNNAVRVRDVRSRRDLFELTGHTGKVTGIALSSDGSRIVTGSADKTARVWDARTGQLLMLLSGHAHPIHSVALSGDASRVVTGCDDGTARVWDGRTGRSLLQLKGHTLGVTSVAMSLDGSRLVTASRDKTVRVWDARAGQTLAELMGHTDGVNGVAMSGDGSHIVTGSVDNTVKVWDARSVQELTEHRATNPGHRIGRVTIGMKIGDGPVKYNEPPAFQAVDESADKIAHIFDNRNGQGLLELKGHVGTVSSVAVSADGNRIVTGSLDKTARVWDARNGQSLFELNGHADCVNCVAVSADGNRIVTGSRDMTARVWNACTGVTLLELIGHTDGVGSVAISGDGRRILTGSGKTARVWDARTGASLLELTGHTSVVTSVAISGDGSRIATGSNDKTARVWDARTGASLLVLKAHTAEVNGVALSVDGSQIVTGSRNAVCLWDAGTGRRLLELLEDGSVHGVALSVDGSRIIAGYGDQTVRIWDARTGQKLLLLKGYSAAGVFRYGSPKLAMSTDGTLIVMATNDMNNTAQVWDARRPGSLELRGHTSRVESLALSADGNRIVTGSDKTARVWDAHTGASLLELTGPTRCVAINGDGSRIVTASFLDNSACVWDARVGRRLLELRGHTSGVRSVAISGDGSRIVTGSFDKTARVWDGQTGQSLLELKGHAGRVLSVALCDSDKRIVTRDHLGATIAWDALNGTKLSGVTPGTVPENSRITRDGQFMFVAANHLVVRVPVTVSEDDCLRRRWLTRPDPDWHVDQCKKFEFEKNDYAAGLHRSFEQQARGAVAIDLNQFDKAYWHFVAAAVLKGHLPKTPVIRAILEKKLQP